MDSTLLPEELRPENMLQPSATDYPISRTNPVTGYETYLYASGNPSLLGWLYRRNDDAAARCVYIRRPLAAPALGSTGYVIMDVLPEYLDGLLRSLQSDEPLQIRFAKATADSAPAAFLEHRQ